MRGSAGKKNKALVKNEPGKRRVVKYTRSPVPDVSTSDNDDSWMGGPQFRQAPLGPSGPLFLQLLAWALSPPPPPFPSPRIANTPSVVNPADLVHRSARRLPIADLRVVVASSFTDHRHARGSPCP